MDISTNTASLEKMDGRPVRETAGFKWIIWLLPFGYLWFRLIDNLRLEWGSNPQYSFGWVVPLLVVGMLIRRWHQASGRFLSSEAMRPWLGIGLIGLFAFFYLPTRLVEAATPEWRPIQWLLGMEAIGLTLAGVYVIKGKSCLLQVAFECRKELVAAILGASVIQV